MSEFKIHKVVSSLPTNLEADAIYAIRVGSGYDLVITDSNANPRYLNQSGLTEAEKTNLIKLATSNSLNLS